MTLVDRVAVTKAPRATRMRASSGRHPTNHLLDQSVARPHGLVGSLSLTHNDDNSQHTHA